MVTSFFWRGIKISKLDQTDIFEDSQLCFFRQTKATRSKAQIPGFNNGLRFLEFRGLVKGGAALVVWTDMES